MANVLFGIHCVVPGCESTLRRVNLWKVKACSKPKHKGKTHAQCMCPEPYQFFKFPTEIKLQRLWLERVRRPDVEVNNLTRVCSLHFIDGRPTRRHYFPNMNLQYDEEEEDEGNDNEGEQQEYYEEDEEGEPEVKIPAPPPLRKGRSAAVSIVPMERLQEKGGDEEIGGQEEEEQGGYEGNLTISRLNYHGGNEDGAYEAPNNSVTITRVTSLNPNPAPYTKPANRFINTNKGRLEKSPTGNRFLRDRVTRNPPPSFVPGGKLKPALLPSTARPSPLIKKLTGGNGKSFPQDGYRNTPQVQQQPEEENDDCPYEIDMVVDEEEDRDSSDLSDIGIDIQPTSKMKQRFNARDLHAAKTMSSMARGLTPAPVGVTSPQKDLSSMTKPKLIPILAVAPKSQLHQQGPVVASPPVIQTITRAKSTVIVQDNKKPSSADTVVPATSVISRPAVATSLPVTVLVPNTIAKPVSNSVISNPPSTVAKPDTSSSLPPQFSSTSNLSFAANNSNEPTPSTLATYDPTKQQLQIANPVKYIQECHTRIAQLLAEKGQLESRNMELEGKVQELQKSNNDLRREIVHQALNAARRAPQQLSTPTFNLVPSSLLDASCAAPSSSAASQNDNDNSETTQPRFRYIIRRPPNVASKK